MVAVSTLSQITVIILIIMHFYIPPLPIYAQDKATYYHDGPFFKASLLSLRADIPPSSNFNMLLIRNGGQNITSVTGDAKLVHTGPAVISGPLLVGGSVEEYDRYLSSMQERAVRPAFSVLGQEGRELATVDHNGRLVALGGLAAGRGRGGMQ